jgi:hypothetical protein|tara:strand:- start:565 stop:957 length:393 start_codon:yes stop_codon:yes gene_type:complete
VHYSDCVAKLGKVGKVRRIKNDLKQGESKHMRKTTNICIALAMTAFSFSASAGLRCDNGLVSEGDTTLEVELKCGKPVNSSITNPATDADGNLLEGGATVERWVYGPNNGMYRYLRFVDGTLVDIDSKRQ